MKSQKAKTYHKRCDRCGTVVITAKARRRACYKPERNSQGFATGYRCGGKLVTVEIVGGPQKKAKRAKRAEPTLEQRFQRAERAAQKYQAAAVRADKQFRKWALASMRLRKKIAAQQSVIQSSKTRAIALDDEGEN